MSKKKTFLQKNKIYWKDNTELLKAVSMLSQLGLVMVSAIVIGVFSGFAIDRYFNFSGIFLAIGTISGVIAGSFVDWKLLINFFKEKNHTESKGD